VIYSVTIVKFKKQIMLLFHHKDTDSLTVCIAGA